MVITTIPLAGGTAETDDDARRVVQAATATAGLVIPALFLGSVIFKLLLAPRVFVFRREIALLKNPVPHDQLPPGGHHLAIRLYSTTPLRLLELNCKLILRLTTTVEDAGNVGRFRTLVPTNPTWPVGETHLPHTIRVKLDNADLVVEDEALKLVSICGYDVQDGDQLHVLVTATVPELGSTFAETHQFAIPGSITQTTFKGIDAVEGVASHCWAGWTEFDT